MRVSENTTAGLPWYLRFIACGDLHEGFARIYCDTCRHDGPGTVQHFMLSYILQKNGMTMQDVIRSTMGSQPAAQSFVAGQNDANVLKFNRVIAKDIKVKDMVDLSFQ